MATAGRTKYAYDHGQRWVRKTLDTAADGTIEESRVFVHDNGQIVLDFQKTGTTAASNSDLANRYLWGTNVDELLADEVVDDGTEDDNRWTLTDHLNSVRDLVVYNPVTGTVSVVKNVAYDAFGNVTSDSAAAVKSLFLYTARPFDADTDLQNNLNRWYDLSTGRWMSVDPIGFLAGDVNLYRYVGNGPSASADPLGLWEILRQGGSKATAIAGENDILFDLAKEIGLDATQVNQWARLFSCTGPVDPPYLMMQPVYDIARRVTGIDPCRVWAEIPNTMLAVWMGDLGGGGRAAVNWTRDMRYMKSLGFKVNEKITAGGKAIGFASTVGSLTTSRDLHGAFVWGHGHPLFFGSKDSKEWIDHSDVVQALNYNLALVIQNFCHGDYSTGDSYRIRGWDWTTMTFMTDSGPVDHGGRDWLADSPGALYSGKKGTLYPIGFFNPAGWKWATVTDFDHVDEVISPGQQGTRER